MTTHHTSNLSLVSPSACLLSEFTKSFIGHFTPETWQHHVVILPTQRLITAFHAMLSDSVPAFFPPMSFTPETYLRRGPLVESSQPKVIDEHSLALLMHKIREEKAFKTIFNNQLSEARVLLREMIEDEIDPRNILRLTEQKTATTHSAEHGDFLRRRFTEVSEWLWETIEHVRQSEHLLSEQAEKLHIDQLIQRIDSQPSCVANTHFVGLTSLNASWNRLLVTLAKTPCSFWLSDFRDDSEADDYPISHMRNLIAPHANVQIVALPAIVDEKHTHPPILTFPSAYEEVKHVWEIAKTTATHHQATAILLADEVGYAPLLSAVIESDEKDINDAVARPRQHATIHNWFQCFLEIGTSHELSAEQAASLLTHPFSRILANSHENHIPISQHIQYCRDRDLPYWQPHVHTDTTLFPLVDLLGKVWPLWRKSADSHCTAIAEWLRNIVTINATNLDRQVVSDAEAVAAAMEQIQDHKGVSSTTRCEIIGSMLKEFSLRAIGEPLNDLQILNLSEARYFPFQNVFLLGCSDDFLPQRAPQDTLIDDYTKRLLGLAGWTRIEQMQLQNFALLRHRLPGLNMSHSRTAAGEERFPATILEQLAATGQCSFSHRHRNFVRQESAPSSRLQHSAIATNDARQHMRELSASSLQNLLDCPFKFALNKLGVRSYDFEERALDAAAEGEWMHEILCAFFRNNQFPNEPLWPDHPLSAEEFKSTAHEKLLFLTDHFAPDSTALLPVVMHLKHYSWPKFIDHVLTNLPATAAQPMMQHRKEFSLQKDGTFPVVTLAGEQVQLSGRIDSIDVEDGFTLITDYKRNATANRTEIAKGFVVQLPTYMEALRTYVPKPLVSGYWSIIAAEFTEGSCDEGQTSCPTTLQGKKPISQASSWNAVQAHAEWRLKQIKEASGFLPDPSSCGFCTFTGICRKDDHAHSQETAPVELWQERMRDFDASST